MTTPPRQSIRKDLQKIGVTPLKSLGQNFLVDPKCAARMLKNAKISEKDNVLEIGPGIGMLTERILKKGAFVTAVEKDRKLFHFLKERYGQVDRINIIEGDILEIPFDASSLPSPSYKIISNLPYNISSQVILKIIMSSELFEDIYLGLQNEVALRLASKEGSKAYGLLSPLLQKEYIAKVLFTIPPKSFYPSPKVTSAFLHLKRKEIHPLSMKEDFLQFLKKSFAQRRKKLLNNLKKHYPEQEVRDAFNRLDISENARAESLSPDTFFELFKGIKKARLDTRLKTQDSRTKERFADIIKNPIMNGKHRQSQLGCRSVLLKATVKSYH